MANDKKKVAVDMDDDIKLKAEIKIAEDKRRQEALKKAAPRRVEELKLSFDSWYALRSRSFPKKHYKEIIWADFKARGLSQNETCSSYDEALERYGVKLDR